VERSEVAVVVLLVVVRLSAIFVDAAVLERQIDAPGQLCGHRGDGLLCSDAAAKCAAERSELAV